MKKNWFTMAGGVAILLLGLVVRAETNAPAGEAAPGGTPAAGSVGTNPAGGFSDVQLTEIESDGPVELSLKTHVFTFKDNVRVNNPQMKLACEVLMMEAPRLAQGKFNRVTAERNVVIDFWGTNRATADKAVYTYSLTNDLTNATVVLTGNSMITNSQGAIQGEVITYDLLRDAIFYTGGKATIQQAGTNTPNFFDALGTQKTNAPKPKADGTLP